MTKSKSYQNKTTYENGYVKAHRNIMQEINIRCGYGYVELYLAILSHDRYDEEYLSEDSSWNCHKCFPSYSVLIKECNISLNTLKAKLKKLNDTGCLQIVSGKQGVANTYYFPLEPFYKDDCDTVLDFGHGKNGHRPYRIKDVRRKKNAFKKKQEKKEISCEKSNFSKDFDDDLPF